MDKKRELIDVWVSKFALTKGIIHCKASICEDVNKDMIEVDKREVLFGENYFHKDEWFSVKGEAIAKAEKMRLAKIKTLEKQLNKLKSLKFE